MTRGGARGICVGRAGEKIGEFSGFGVETLPPVAVGMEDDGATAENLLDALRIFSGDGDDHVDEFSGAERLADEWAHADEFGFFFGVFDEDGFGKWHGITVSEISNGGRRISKAKRNPSTASRPVPHERDELQSRAGSPLRMIRS